MHQVVLVLCLLPTKPGGDIPKAEPTCRDVSLTLSCVGYPVSWLTHGNLSRKEVLLQGCCMALRMFYEEIQAWNLHSLEPYLQSCHRAVQGKHSESGCPALAAESPPLATGCYRLCFYLDRWSWAIFLELGWMHLVGNAKASREAGKHIFSLFNNFLFPFCRMYWGDMG